MVTRKRKIASDIQLPAPKPRPPIWPSRKTSSPFEQATWPELVLVFFLFLASRLLSALFNNINDCDETYNYWEPAHLLLYKNGFQTWEYSPTYSIRSYFYLWLYIFPASVLNQFVITDKIFIFYFTKIYIALIAAIIETFLFWVILNKFKRETARLYCFISIFSSGMFVSTTAFLPSSFAQIISFLAIGFWFMQSHKAFIFCSAFNAIVGWPFSIAICIPMALHVLYKRTFSFIFWSAIFGAIITLITMLVDSHYYGKYVLASLNILLYNVFSSNGPDLYGTEPFQYYLNNLFLNYNVLFTILPFSLISILLVSYTRKYRQMLDVNSSFEQLFTVAALYLWFIIFAFQSHKEERFMYPIYPLISLTAAFTLINIQQIFGSFWPKYRQATTFATMFVFVLLSVSRTIALYKGYSASIRIYEKFSDITKHNLEERNETILCLAKEWHRFPSNFFVPSNVKVEFIPSEFRGQLPKHYDLLSEQPTRIIPSNMNDENKEELSRYIPLSSCHFIIDSNYPSSHGRDLPYSNDSTNWSIVYSLPFLDNSQSRSIFRAFYVPFLSEKFCNYIDYNILASKNVTVNIVNAQ